MDELQINQRICRNLAAEGVGFIVVENLIADVIRHRIESRAWHELPCRAEIGGVPRDQRHVPVDDTDAAKLSGAKLGKRVSIVGKRAQARSQAPFAVELEAITPRRRQ